MPAESRVFAEHTVWQRPEPCCAVWCTAALFWFSYERNAAKFYIIAAPRVHSGCLLRAVESLLLSYSPFTEERQIKSLLTKPESFFLAMKSNM